MTQFENSLSILVTLIIAPFEKVGLYKIWDVCHSVCSSVRPSIHHKFISAQYLENKMTEFYQIFNANWYWQDLGWDCYMPFFAHLHQSYGPWFSPEFRFRSISWERNDRFSPNFVYAMILTRCRLKLLHVIFHSLVPELGPLIYTRISFTLNILRKNWQIFSKFYICIVINKI